MNFFSGLLIGMGIPMIKIGKVIFKVSMPATEFGAEAVNNGPWSLIGINMLFTAGAMSSTVFGVLIWGGGHACFASGCGLLAFKHRRIIYTQGKKIIGSMRPPKTFNQ
jgi:hypothetical protein